MLHGAALLLVPDSASDAEHNERLFGALAQELLQRDEALIVEGPCMDAVLDEQRPPTCTHAILPMPAPELGSLQGASTAAGALLIKRCCGVIMVFADGLSQVSSLQAGVCRGAASRHARGPAACRGANTPRSSCRACLAGQCAAVCR